MLLEGLQYTIMWFAGPATCILPMLLYEDQIPALMCRALHLCELALDIYHNGEGLVNPWLSTRF